MTTNIVLIAYGLFLIIGGLMGLKKGSKISLVMGGVSGILVFIGLWWMKTNPRLAWYFLSCLNALLSVSFVSRLLKTRKFMPSGLMLVIVLGLLVFCLSHIHA